MILIKLIGLSSMIVLAFKIASSKDMVLEKVGNYAEYQVEKGKKYFELLTCPFCMGSIFSFPAFLIAYAFGVIELSWNLLLLYPMTVFGTSICAGFTWTLYTILNTWNEKNESEKKYFETTEQLAHFEVKDRKEKYKAKINHKERSY